MLRLLIHLPWHLHSISDLGPRTPAQCWAMQGVMPPRGGHHWSAEHLEFREVWDVETLWHKRAVTFNSRGSTGEVCAGDCLSQALQGRCVSVDTDPAKGWEHHSPALGV